MKSIECVRTISFSEFNPPPRNRRRTAERRQDEVEEARRANYLVQKRRAEWRGGSEGDLSRLPQERHLELQDDVVAAALAPPQLALPLAQPINLRLEPLRLRPPRLCSSPLTEARGDLA